MKTTITQKCYGAPPWGHGSRLNRINYIQSDTTYPNNEILNTHLYGLNLEFYKFGLESNNVIIGIVLKVSFIIN
jgi:hypothetical protein